MQRYLIVTISRLTGIARTLFIAAIFWLAFPHPGHAMEYFIDTKADMDTIRLVFDQRNLSGNVRRTGRKEITLSFPADSLNSEKKPTPTQLSSLRIVDSIKMGPSSIVIGTRETGFGFIRLPAGNGEMIIQIFRDPIGSKWRSPQEKARLKAVRKKAAERRAQRDKAAAKRKAEERKKLEQQAKVAAEQKKTKKNIPEPLPARAEPAPIKRREVSPPAISEIDIPDSKDSSALNDEPSAERNEQKMQQISPASRNRPFYSVPYTYRAPVENVGPGQAEPVSTSVPAAGAVQGDAARRPVASGGGDVARQVGSSAAQGGVSGSVVPPEPDRLNEVDPLVSVASEGGVAGRVSPPAAREGGVAGRVSPPAASEGGVVRKVSPPAAEQGGGRGKIDNSGVSNEIDPPKTAQSDVLPAGEVSPASDDVYPDGYGEGGYTDNGTKESFADSASNESEDASIDNTDAYPVEDSAQLADAADGEEGKKELTLEDKLKVAKGILLAAESALGDGQPQAAVDGFKKISLLPYISNEMRLRALYGKAESLTELYKDALADNFGETSSAWMEAMNADTKAPNVPMALLNLGLLNLKVGNMPEAKAYFNILKSQYPNDLNIPYISYYWGQYYLGMEEYEKAADQFQYLVQMYPDSKVVRDAALGLAKALDKLGYDEQAYQIIDYIDKRWPRFYIEDLEFLFMAANTQNRLGKLDDAKGNYWAYYNLAPDAKEADIVLARIGDIYLKQGDKAAAKQIYDKDATDFPDKEGGLVSMMRLAEEGIYDDPSMNQMDKVFDRPYNLRPQKIYTRIVDKHPDSPLAPLAQLKLGMWYYWNKKYGDCLGAVQDFLEKYPRSGLRDKASQLGSKVFDRAVPELVKDENYGRVVNYWNKYAANIEESKGINDETRMGIALSYWKKEQPEKALELIDRYLQKKEIPKYSTMALDMALGIYVEEQLWSKASDLVNMARENWKVDPKQQAHIEYAQAMAYENLGETERSTPLWAGLASNLLLPESSRAYAMYYMAKSSMKKKDLKKVFIYAQEALSMLLETSGDREKIKDCILMTIYAAESSGRYREALKWAAEYDKYIPLSDPEWASSRFRLAQLYEKFGAVDEWRKLMEEVRDKSSGGLYGRLAASALATRKIEKQASKFKPAPTFQ